MRAQACGQHGDERHEGEPDHQRRCGRRRARRVAHGVGAGERARGAPDALGGPSQPAHEPGDEARGEHRDADEQDQRPDADRQQVRSRGARSEQAEQHQRDRRAERRQGGQGAQPREACGRQHRALAHGRDRRHARGAQGGAQRGQQRYEHPHDQRHSHRARGENRARVRQIDAEGDQQRVEPLRQREAEQEPDQRGEQADCERFEQHRPQHLAPRRAERAQRRELARALGDGDRERVGDHEAADEQGDPAEGEQEVPEDVEETVRCHLYQRVGAAETAAV